jgi:hypothetical protein
MAKNCAPGDGAMMGDEQYKKRQGSRGMPPKGKQISGAPKSNKSTGSGMGKALPGKKPK